MTERKKQYKGILSGNQLKIIAAASMTLDHVGVQIFPEYILLRIVGRISFPVFAYMIAEGCKYTKNRKRYLITMAVLALACQLVYFFVQGSLYQCVLVAFSLSVLLIYALDNAITKRTLKSCALALIAFFGVFFLTDILPKVLSHTDFFVDYGLFGVLLPVFIYIGRGRIQKLILAAIALILLSFSYGSIQWFSLASIFVLALYNGKKGQTDMKNFFYIYYPAHLAVIYLISRIVV